MTDWYHLYLEQQMGIFRPNMEPWEKLSGFDQTTLWWLLKKEKDIPIYLENWIEKNLTVNKENVKLPKGKYIENLVQDLNTSKVQE